MRPPRLRHAALATAVLSATVAVTLNAASAATTTYVALGDSYTSGPAIPKQVAPTGCGRSDHSYPYLVAAAIGARLTDRSCGGSTTVDMTKPQSIRGGTNPPEFSALRASTSLVTVGIGGNDVGFSDIATICGLYSITNPFGAPCKAHFTSNGTDQLLDGIRATAPKIDAVLKGIHQRSPRARVLLVGYPDLLPSTGPGCWSANVPVAADDTRYLDSIETALNSMLASQAAANNATYVDTYTDSVGHDVCKPAGTRWIEGLFPTSPAAHFHPNAAGQRAMAQQVITATTRRPSAPDLSTF